MRTFSQKPADVQRNWYLVDASEASLGRLATRVAGLLLGKGKTTVTPHTDGGDFVVVINTTKVIITGEKENKKEYFRHSGFPGGIHKRSFSQQQAKDPQSIVYKSVRGMLPDNKLRPGRLARLKIYADEEHNHTAQQPERISLKDKN